MKINRVKKLTQDNLPDLEERAKALGISLEKALELINVEQFTATNNGYKPATNQVGRPKRKKGQRTRRTGPSDRGGKEG
jgi:hypothetical protein